MSSRKSPTERVLDLPRRYDVDALDVHLVISAYCVFQVANRYTFGFLFDVDFTEVGQRAHLRRMIGDVVVGWLTAR